MPPPIERASVAEVSLIEGISQTPEAVPKYDPKLATPFIQKSLSENTKAAYRRVIKEFFAFVGERHPSQISHTDVLAFRDQLLRQKKKAATVAFKLSVVRSLFEYLKAAGMIERNPASAKLVPPPELPEDTAGRALTAKEVHA